MAGMGGNAPNPLPETVAVGLGDLHPTQPVRSFSSMARGSLEVLKLDRLIHDPTRLLILTFLYQVPTLEYLWLQKQLTLTTGNLCSHLAALEKARYVAIEKGFKGKYPKTVCGMTKKGRKMLALYAQTLMQVSEAAKSSNESET